MNLNSLATSSAQQVFDHIVTGLLDQGAKSISMDVCQYRGPDGLRCAGGLLLSDSDYSPSMEGQGWIAVAGDRAHYELIVALQKVHDNFDVGRWPSRFVAIAEKFNLSPDAIVNHTNKNQVI